jgi:hypothetical protein
MNSRPLPARLCANESCPVRGGRKFTPSSRRQRYCSPACQRVGHVRAWRRRNRAKVSGYNRAQRLRRRQERAGVAVTWDETTATASYWPRQKGL